MVSLDVNLITQKIIGCAYEVSNTLGTGFVEKVYENALAHQIRFQLCSNIQSRSVMMELWLVNSLPICWCRKKLLSS